MPVRNEAAHIERALASVLAQDYPPQRFEVIVVDGCSDDGTGEVVARLADAYRLRPVAGRNHPPDLFLVNNPARYVPSALNLALERARGDVIVRVDGHCEIAPNYFRACLDAMARTGADCVGGALDTVGETWMARAIALAQSSWFGVGGAGFRMKQAQGKFVDTLAFGAYRREVFQRIGPFDESLLRNQDDEFNFRLLQAGGKIWLDPEVHSVYYSRASLRGLCRQYFEYGLYKVLVIRKRGGLASWRHLVPATFVLGMTALFALGLFTDRWSPFWFVLGIYSAAAAVAATARSLPTWPSIPIVALAFSVMHVSYGIGFLRGIWKWRHVRIQR
jgi:glycosyltransferase involved in cell wall biosynthesis